MGVLKIEKCIVKAFTKKVGAPKTKLTLLSEMTPKIARELGVHSIVYDGENLPKQGLIEVELDVKRDAPFDLKLDAEKIPEVLCVPACIEASDWIAKRKGSTKRGQASKLLLEFKVAFTGVASGVFEWLEKYGQVPGALALTPGAEQQELKGADVAAAAEAAQKAEGKGKANGAAASSGTVQ